MIKIKKDENIDYRSFPIRLATWFGCGLINPGPGTWGTLGGLPLGVLLLFIGGWPLLATASIIICIIGYWASDQYEKASNSHDAGAIVIDEVTGIWVTLIPASMALPHIIAAFLLFRFLDILKPFPISLADKHISGALGVMLDDVIAGIGAAVILGGLIHAGYL